MKTATQKIAIISRRARHHDALASLAAKPDKANGMAIWRKLRRLELEAHDAATAQCNGADYGSQPFRPDWLPDGSEGTEETPTPWEEYAATVHERVALIFGFTHKHPPQGFFFNQDARGYSLKLNPDKVTIPDGMETDWGGNGLLAAVIE